MGKKLRVFLVLLCMLLAYAPLSFAGTVIGQNGEYDIVQLTDNLTDDTGPDLNENTNAIWLNNDLDFWRDDRAIMYFDGEDYSETLELIRYTSRYLLNDDGLIALSEYDISYRPYLTDVSVFDGVEKKLVAESGRIINFAGDNLLWFNSANMNTSPYYLHVYDGSDSSHIGTTSSGGVPKFKVNKAGQVVYSTSVKLSDKPIFRPLFAKFYNGIETITLGHSGYTGITPWLNDLGQVVWFDYPKRKYYLYENGINEELTNFYPPKIYGFNNSGQILWKDSSRKLYIYSDGISTEINVEFTPDTYSRITFNDNGYVAWSEARYERVNGIPNYSKMIFGFYAYNGTEVIKLNDGKVSGFDLNNKNEIIWSAHDGNDWEIYLATVVNKDPVEIAAGIIGDLIDLDLPKNDINSFLANLKKVEKFILNGQTAAAIDQVEATIHKIEQDMKHDGAITPVGNEFIEQLHELIDLILNM